MPIAPIDVFVPGRFPTGQLNAYAHRGATQRELESALSRGFVPVVFGSYGVGKSSLAMYCAASWAEKSKLVYIPSVYRLSLRAILERVLEHLGYEVTVERVAETRRGGSGEVGFAAKGNVFTFLKASVSGKAARDWEKGDQESRELVIKSPSDVRIIEICEAGGIFLMIDELHRASAPLSRDLSAFLKSYANMNCKRFKICLLGTEDDASGLVIMDQGIDRVLQEIPVEPISRKEAESIIEPGMKRLGLGISKALVERICIASVGSPFIVQYLCLEMAELARAEGLGAVTNGHFELALVTYIKRKAQRAIRAYRSAIETVGAKRYRKQILLAMAKSDDEYVTMDFLVEKVSEQLGEDIPSTALSGPLRELKEARYGRILKDVENPMGIGRLYNYSAFSDPSIKAVIRLVERIDVDLLEKKVESRS